MKRVLLFITFLTFINTIVLANSISSTDNTVNTIEITAPHAVLIDMDSGKMLYEKDAYTPVYPASTTKILTAILVLENCDLDEKVTATYEAVNSVYANGTTASIQEGETHTVRDLLSTMLIHSANDAAYILAEHVGGSVDSFASMMNSKAKELGALSTNFVTPNGLPNTYHKCSAYDMALFANYAMNTFPEFREIVKTINYSLPITPEYEKLYFSEYPNATKATRYLTTTTNHLINPARTAYYYEYATGIKTGYTDAAANCIVASAEKNGVELIVVIFGAGGWGNLRDDTVKLFELGFSKLKSETLTSAGNIIDKIKIKNADNDNNLLNVVVENELKATVSNTDLVEAFSPSVVLSNDLKAPIESGDIIGTITYNIYNRTYSSNLIAGNSISPKVSVTAVATNIFSTIIKIILWFVGIVIFLFIALVFLRAFIITQNQKKSRRRRMYNARFR